MVWIELGRRYVRAIMIDGYIPAQDKLKIIAENLWDEKLSRNRYLLKCLQSEKLSERQLLKTFGNLVYTLRDAFCPIKDSRKRPSCYEPYTTKKNYNSIETIIGHERQKLGKCLVPLTDEYKHDQKKEKSQYIQNVIVCNSNSLTSCRKVNECCINWLEKLNFTIKGQEKYQDYQEFRNAWYNFLDNKLDAVEKFHWFKKKK